MPPAPGIEAFAIAWIEAPHSGRIGISRLPGRTGELEADLGRAFREGASLVLSMTPASEMAAKGAGDLPRAAAQLGMAWRHFPIIDYGAPQDDSSWRLLSEELHRRLDTGANLLLHCAGGKGRSGMIAARLIAERGLSPQAAMALVRTARPGAIETAEQEAWIATACRT